MWRKCLIACVLWGCSLVGYAKTIGIIFDCEGVVVDQELAKYQAWRTVLKPYDIQLQLEEYIPLATQSNEQILQTLAERYQQELPFESLAQEKEALYRLFQQAGMPGIEPAIQLLHQLAQQKSDLSIKLALTAYAPRAEILASLREHDLEGAFDVVLSSVDDMTKKKATRHPSPDVYLEVAKQLNIAPDDCIAFEANDAGVKAAHLAKMMVVAVPSPYTSGQDFSLASHVLQGGFLEGDKVVKELITQLQAELP